MGIAMEAVFRRRRQVVVKIADAIEDLSTEWKAYAALRSAGVAGANILRYFCFFRCSDSLPRVLKESVSIPEGGDLCQGVGDSMQVLVMEHIDGRSMKRFDWSTASDEALRGCLSQVVCAMLDAHMACGFAHGDLHLDNVLVLPTRRDTIAYKCSRTVATNGLLVKLMDFELSKVGAPAKAFFKDLHELFRKSLSDLGTFVDVAPLQACLVACRAWIDEDQRDPRVALDLLSSQIERVRPLERGVYGGAAPLTVRPSLTKRHGVW